MPFQLPQLPYELEDLAPVLSAETLRYHHGKHHKAYVDKLNALIPGTKFAEWSLEEIIRQSSGAIFNNAAQIWNHTFYWNSLTPLARGGPTGRINEAINQTFGSFVNFKKEFFESALNNFGSGWTWLVKDNATGKLAISNSSNAVTPLTDDKVTPLITIDVWEHAYYIDYRNARAKYLDSLWNIINWDFANANIT